MSTNLAAMDLDQLHERVNDIYLRGFPWACAICALLGLLAGFSGGGIGGSILGVILGGIVGFLGWGSIGLVAVMLSTPEVVLILGAVLVLVLVIVLIVMTWGLGRP